MEVISRAVGDWMRGIGTDQGEGLAKGSTNFRGDDDKMKWCGL